MNEYRLEASNKTKGRWLPEKWSPPALSCLMLCARSNSRQFISAIGAQTDDIAPVDEKTKGTI